MDIALPNYDLESLDAQRGQLFQMERRVNNKKYILNWQNIKNETTKLAAQDTENLNVLPMARVMASLKGLVNASTQCPTFVPMQEHFLILVLEGPRPKEIPYSLTSLTLLYLPHCPGELRDSTIKVAPPNTTIND